jgi:hypothetical protein
MTRQLKVPSTSRLVLEAAMQLYTTSLQQCYIESIDFSETSRIFHDLKHHYPLILDAICLRKQSIREMLRERITSVPGQQVILLGAGLDPLSLYLLENYREQLSRIIEVDNGYIRHCFGVSFLKWATMKQCPPSLCLRGLFITSVMRRLLTL